MLRPVGAPLFCASVVCVALAFLSGAKASSELPHQQPHSDHFIAGMKGVTVSERAHTEEGTVSLSGYGVAGFGELTLLHDHLALEVDFVVTAPGRELSWATEPLIKVPLHVTRWLEPYAAAGPMFVHVRDELGRRHHMGGGQLVLGSYLWFARNFGIDLDLSLGAARGPDMSMVEFVVALGPIMRD